MRCRPLPPGQQSTLLELDDVAAVDRTCLLMRCLSQSERFTLPVKITLKLILFGRWHPAEAC